METNKYYTPTIEEFHVEFEFEVQGLEDSRIIWKSIIPKNIAALTLIDRMTIRVKYLDKEDIESLGWIGSQDTFRLGDWRLYRTSFDTDDKRVYLIENVKEKYKGFRGTIKNKSELKRLMQQLGIYEQHNK